MNELYKSGLTEKELRILRDYASVEKRKQHLESLNMSSKMFLQAVSRAQLNKEIPCAVNLSASHHENIKCTSIMEAYAYEYLAHLKKLHKEGK